ncbi:hypothetical protein C8A03DRAFT_17427 [Achaetomium macrosporum]|uniref:Rad21/Rec8-like protein N-terminal domain-containing protein n=1 Tax=Achaetomium macrosporum TaxID=79813 RepID=A0AAN7C613_9PEZI|nr:hypothetical protein C8A03DRAFT_17427 [Achaetomium macrosporum]
MFYSHEILTNETYGVATVWLVSTIGLRSTTRKISRKAIQEVNVKKACETILKPGAPIALRLQGSLLYGLSRVYSQQCHYVLTDAEKVHAHMRAFYNAIGGRENALDPQAGKAKRQELILEDDPEFDLNPVLPAFHFGDDGNLVVPQESQTSRKTSSQLSPLQGEGSLSSSNRCFPGGFDLSHSPFGGRNSLVEEPFGSGKADDDLMPLGDEERELQAFDDWGIEIDADGNIIPAMEEPQLPRLPRAREEENATPMPQDEFIMFDDEGDLIMGGAGSAFNSDPPLPLGHEELQEGEQQQEPEQNRAEEGVAVQDELSSGQAPVRVRWQRRRPVLAPDDQTKITRQELKSWSANYLANAEQARQPRHGITATEARANAFSLVFGRGIAGVGFPTGVPGFPHPLASHFAGEGLQARLLGIIITHPDGEDTEAPRGRRRSALEALELEGDDAERRVRRRIGDQDSEDDQHAQRLPQPDDALPPFPEDDELPPVEVGRRAGSVLPDIPSDVPWNRPSSQIPSSSVKGGASKPPSRHISVSPLHGRGSLSLIPGPEIERFSDDHQAFLGSDGLGSQGFAPLHSGPAGSSMSDPITFGAGDAQPTSQVMRHALDREGKNFLDYVESVAKEKGYPDDDENNNRRWWVDFDQLFEPEDQKRAVVAQAFYHVLSLATKNVIKVKQDGQGGHEPFGAIRLGVEGLGDIGTAVGQDVEGMEEMEGIEGMARDEEAHRE